MDKCLDKLSGQGLQEEISLTLKNISRMQFSPSQAIAKTLETMENRLKELYKEEWKWRKQDFEVLQEVALNTGGIQEFISEYVLDPKLETTVKEGENGPKDACILTTIHSAKGLEANYCYLVKASPASYPTPRAIENGEEAIEEERRCLYVALTRAKDELYVYRNIHSIHVDESSEDDAEKLYFFNSLPDELIDKDETATAQRITVQEYKGEVVGTDIIGDFDFS